MNTDRVRLVFYIFVGFGVIIVWMAFKYTVFEYDYYRKLADKQQMITVKNPVSRGTIYSNNTPTGVFATSTDLSDLAVDPKGVGSKEKLVTFLGDVIFEELCSKGFDEQCGEDVFEYLKQAIPEDTTIITEENIKTRIREDVLRKISKEFVDSVIVKENLSEEEIKDTMPLTE